jgi:hypothetical protein
LSDPVVGTAVESLDPTQMLSFDQFVFESETIGTTTLRTVSLSLPSHTGAVIDLAVLAGLAGAAGIVSAVAATGFVGIRDDGALAYLSPDGSVGPERVEVTLRHHDGGEEQLVLELLIGTDAVIEGWGEGEHYVLARDAAGWSIAEPGENHRMVYVSTRGSAGASGLTPGEAITPGALGALMKTLLVDPARPALGSQMASWHVLFERGQDYGAFSPGYVSGESPLHPFVIGAWGQGDRPVFGKDIDFGATPTSNVLIRDIEFAYSPGTALVRPDSTMVRGIDILGGGHQNLMYENVLVRPYNASPRIQSGAQDVTLYRTTVLDAHREEPAKAGNGWRDTLGDRIQGLYATKVDGLLIEQSLFDRNGWEFGYKPTGAYGASQPPSMYSHNLYIDFGARDVTLRDNVISRGASFGANVRPGGVLDGNLVFGNNAAVNLQSGGRNADGTFAGNYSLLIDTVVTNPANKNAYNIGARGWGVVGNGGGLVADTIAAQDGTGLGSGPTGVRRPLDLRDTSTASFAWEGATVFNWGAAPDVTPEADGISKQALLGVTLDAYARALLGGTRDRFDLLRLWRERDRSDWDDIPGADDVTAWFRAGFGYDSPVGGPGRTVTFEGDPRAEGFRWDNRLNWSDDAGPADGDFVRLNGHAVTYGTDTLRLAGLDFGRGGALRVTQALVEVAPQGGTVAGDLGGSVTLANAGQFLFRGYDDADPLRIDVDGGRMVNTGVVAGRVEIDVRGGQAILAEGGGAMTLRAGASLALHGDAARVGFDSPSGTARLTLDGGALRFVFDSDGVSAIGEFRSGRHGTQMPGVTSRADLLDGSLLVDLAGLDPLMADRRFTLIDVDRLEGGLGGLDVTITGVAAGQVARLVWDDAVDALFLDVGLAL